VYGAWFIFGAGLVIGVVVLVIALVIAASPLLAVILALVFGAGAAAVAATRRSREYREGSEATPHPARPANEPADVIGSRAIDRGAPAGGEGATSASSSPTALPPNPGAPSRSSDA
jgi:hypothetical protein